MKQLKIQHHADVRKLNDELATANIVKKREISKVNYKFINRLNDG